MARRGEALRDHILDSAKLAFLEGGFSGTSMDAIAARAQTSKRSLYAHFASKDVLLIAVVERMRMLFEERIATPGEYAGDPVDAIIRFCARLLGLIRWSNVALTLRIGIAEADRLPDVARGIHDALFASSERRLGDYLQERCGLAEAEAAAATTRIIALVAYPAVQRILFAVDPLRESLEEPTARDLDEIRGLAGEEIAGAVRPVRG